ncbi:hypothetical protein F4Y43_20260 [Candidatus Poribacteria bacterium]|nr:hypothetical protein [Candidatus Poribacteria bacterium]
MINVFYRNHTTIGQFMVAPMKRMLSLLFILTLLGSTTLWALRGEENGRDYNRDVQWKSDTMANTKWATCRGADSDGNISSYATITVDVDTITENWGEDVPWYKKIQRRGVDYSAYANIWADASTGSYSLSAVTPGDMEGPSGIVNGDTYREASASDFDWMNNPGDVEQYLGNASSSGTVSIPGHRSEAKAEDFGVIGDS